MSFKRPNPINKKLKPLYQKTIDFSSLISYKDDAKYKPVIAVKGEDSNPRIILQTMTNNYKEIVDFLVAIGEPVVRTKNFHEYELNKFSLYSAASMGIETNDIIDILANISKNHLQKSLKDFIIENTKKYGLARLILRKKRYFIVCKNEEILNNIKRIQQVRISNESIRRNNEYKMQIEENKINEDNPYESIPPHSIEIEAKDFGKVKEACENHECPLIEEFSFREDEGNVLNITPKFKSPVRAYQEKALNIMCGNGIARSGIIVLPCGAGKTLVGILAICTIKRNTIIICNNNLAVQQWKREITDWVDIIRENKNKKTDKKIKEKNKEEEDSIICRFTSDTKDKLWNFEKEAGILITSFTMLSFSGQRNPEVKKAMDRLEALDWGLMIIDEVQLLPAETFSTIIKEKYKSHCKLGLTATLVREDEGIKDLYLYLGPKLYEANWLDLQNDGFLARVKCVEIWSEMDPEFYEKYLEFEKQKNDEFLKVLYVSNPNKYLITLILLEKHKDDKIIIFSDNLFTILQYNRFFEEKKLKFRMIHGKTGRRDREKYLSEFRNGTEINILLMTRVGDISLDIPNANVVIQISSHFSSRMQEAQRFGRILRPKKDVFSEYNAFFYTIVSKNTKEMIYSNNRHRFLVDQGYYFTIINDIGKLIEIKDEKDEEKSEKEKEKEKNEIIEIFKKDESYLKYIKETYNLIEYKFNKNEKIEKDFDEDKDLMKLINEDIKSDDYY